MKRTVLIFALLLILGCFSLPVSAAITVNAKWPPDPYDGAPVTVYNQDNLSTVGDSVKSSMQAISVTGMRMLAPLIPVFFIILCVGEVMKVHLQFNKDLKAVDYRHKINNTWIDLNHDIVIQEKVKGKELNILANQRFREIHPDYDEDEMERRFNIMQLIRKRHAKNSNQILEEMEHRHSLMEIIKERHKKTDDQIIAEREHKRLINRKDMEENFDSVVDDRVNNIVINAAAQERFREKFPELEFNEAVRRADLHDSVRQARRSRTQEYYKSVEDIRKSSSKFKEGESS